MAPPSLRPVPDEPALVVDDTLVVADLHIGKEEELREAGFSLPSQAERMGDRVVRLLQATGARRLVILGDLKHRVPRFTGAERHGVPRFFDRLEAHLEAVHLVPGNHDGKIELILPRWVTLHPVKGVRMDGVGYVHGHAWPAADVMAGEVLLTGHNHPTLLFPDRLGFRTIERCWIRVDVTGSDPRYPEVPEEIVVVPAFNEFSGGTTMNETGTRYLGPLLNSDLVDMGEARAYLLNGTYLGPLAAMMVEGRGEQVEE